MNDVTRFRATTNFGGSVLFYPFGLQFFLRTFAYSFCQAKPEILDSLAFHQVRWRTFQLQKERTCDALCGHSLDRCGRQRAQLTEKCGCDIALAGNFRLLV